MHSAMFDGAPGLTPRYFRNSSRVSYCHPSFGGRAACDSWVRRLSEALISIFLRKQSVEEKYDKCKGHCFRCCSGKRHRQYECCIGHGLAGADTNKSSCDESLI
jgi:hypothetical protein